MSTYESLQPSTRELIESLAAVKDDAGIEGNNENEKGEIGAWVTKIGQGSYGQESQIEELNKELATKTYLVSNHLTVADIALYHTLHPIVAALAPERYYALPSLTRYFDNIQHHPSLRSAPPSTTSTIIIPPLVEFDLENAPKQERKAEVVVKKKKEPKAAGDEAQPSEGGKKKKGKEGVVATATSALSEGAAAVGAAVSGAVDAVQVAVTSVNEGEAPGPSQGKKEKKEKAKKEPAEGGKGKGKGGAAGGSGGDAAAESGEPVPSMIDLRVGHIVDIEKHPDADGLYVEQIDLGEETGPRTVVSGLVHYIPIEQMQNQYVVAVCNLKPANMRGVKSHAMVLCATHKDGKDAGIELVQPPAGSKPGERVYFEGEKYESAQALSQLNPKKKIFETIQPGFTTLESHEAAWIDPATQSVHKIRTKDGICIAPKFVGASLS